VITIDHSREALVKLLESAGTVFKGNKCRCIFHDDHNPSAGIYQKDGVWRFRCQVCGAGGDLADVEKLLNGSPRNGQAKNNGKAVGPIIATYDYADEKGTILFQKVRREPKQFSLRRPAANGDYVLGLGGARRVLYRLPELIKASLESVVFLTEGEKDADNLADAGLITTTNFEGASQAGQQQKWRQEYSEFFRGRVVAIIADKDDPGRARADHIAQQLLQVASEVRILEVPGNACKDASDYLSTGATADDFLRLFDGASPYKAPDTGGKNSDTPAEPPIVATDICDLLEAQPVLREILIDGCLRRAETANLVAAPKCGKTFCVMNLTIATATGGHWLGRKCTQGSVLLIDNELHSCTLAHRFKKVAESMAIETVALKGRVDIVCLRGQLRDIMQLGLFFSEIPKRKYNLVIIDSLYRMLPRSTEENSNSDLTAIYNKLDQYAQQLDSAFMCVHHVSKGSQSEKIITDVGAGGGAQSRAVDAHLVLRQHEETDVMVLDATVRSFPPLAPSCWRVSIPTFTHMPDLDPTDLRKGKQKRSSAEEVVWTPETFANQVFSGEPLLIEQVELAAKGIGIDSKRECKSLLKQAEAMRLVTVIEGRAGPAGFPRKYARTVSQ
jgi:AAA domain